MKVVPFFIVFVLVLAFQFLAAQAPDILWTKTFDNGIGTSVQQTTDGGYIIGVYAAGMGGCDFWLIKTDASGDTLWTKIFNRHDHDHLHSVQQTTDDGYIMTGYSGLDLWLLKTDISGDTLWTKTFENGNGNSVQQTTDGGYIIVGNTEGDVWLIKTNESGDTLWTKTFGGAKSDEGYSVWQTTDQGYIITGWTSSFGTGPYDVDVLLIKTDESGGMLWTKMFGGSGEDIGYSVQQTADQGYIITGSTSSFRAGSSDVWLIKTDESGGILWTKTFGGNGQDGGRSVQQISNGGYIVLGTIQSFVDPDWHDYDVWLIKTDESGDTLWTKTFGGSSWDFGYSVQQTSDGGYIMTGEIDGDVWLAKTVPDITNVDDEATIISESRLAQNYPNPFNSSTMIHYQLPVKSEVNLSIYNLLGQKITTLVSEKQPSGTYWIEWNARDLPSGIYLYRLKANGYIGTRKLILQK